MEGGIVPFMKYSRLRIKLGISRELTFLFFPFTIQYFSNYCKRLISSFFHNQYVNI